MSFRTVNGNTHTEDGWRCCNRDECDLVRIPDLFLTDTAPIRKGPPLVILGAWLFWYDRNVEEITSPVWGWSEDNAVLGQPGENNGSNHLSATAVDVNAPKYPWGTYRMSADKIAKVEEGRRLFEGSVFWGREWSKPDEMHYQMAWPEGDARNEAFAQKLLGGYLGIYKQGPPPPPPPPTESYGLPTGSNSGGYGGNGVRFPDWVYQLGNAFGVKPSTYPGHQESDRNEAGYAPNPAHLNRAIDWAGSVDDMTRFADYLATIPQFLEQVIWQNPNTGRSIEVAGGRHQPGYFRDDLAGHRDHVHTRQSRPIPMPGGPPPPPPPMSKADGYAVAIIAEGRRRNVTPRGIQIALSVALVESGLKNYANSNVPESMNIPHDAVGTDHDSVGLFQQRCPMWGPAEVLMNPPLSAGLFYDRLVKLDYNNTSRPPGDYAADVQRPAAQYRGRYQERMGDAVALYNRLAGTAPPTQGDDMAAVPQDQWDRVYRELTQKLPSRSPLRHLGEGVVDTVAGFVLNTDGSVHVEIVKLLAGYGHPPTLALLREVAGADPNQYPDRQDDAKIAQAILADVTAAPVSFAPVDTARADVPQQPQVVYVPAPEPVAAVSGGSTGQIIGQAYDALEALQLSGALTETEKAPLAALIGVLQTKTGSQA